MASALKMVCDKEMPFGGLIDENDFSGGNTASPKFSKGILHANQKSHITFAWPEMNENFKSRSVPNRSQESTGDVTFGLARPLETEIVFPPFSAIRQALKTSKRYQIDEKCQQNTNRKPLYRLVT
jgi:hypothetical protein